MDNFGTCKTLFRVTKGFILMFPIQATITRVQSAVAIFLLLGHGE